MTDQNSATVEYLRRVTRKDVDGNYDSITIGGGVTRTYGEELDGTQLVAAWERLFEEFKKTVDAQIDSPAPAAMAPREPLSPEPGGWIANTVNENTQQVQERMQRPEPDDSQGTPSATLLKPLADKQQPVMYERAKVFNIEEKRVGNNTVMNMRIGKRGSDGIPGQYTTAETWDEGIINELSEARVREGDFVNVWGYFKPWKNNPNKFNLVLQKAERVT